MIQIIQNYSCHTILSDIWGILTYAVKNDNTINFFFSSVITKAFHLIEWYIF